MVVFSVVVVGRLRVCGFWEGGGAVHYFGNNGGRNGHGAGEVTWFGDGGVLSGLAVDMVYAVVSGFPWR